MNPKQLNELLLEALETEHGGVEIYRTAVECARNEELRAEWRKYGEQTVEHERVLRDVMSKLQLDPEMETTGRAVVRHLGRSLLQAMKMAQASGDPEAAELVATECVMLAETKDHANWELIGECSKHFQGRIGAALKEAHEQVEDEEDEHLYHTKGWSRELWIQRLGMPAVLPPPEEKQDVKTAIAASRAKHARERMV